MFPFTFRRGAERRYTSGELKLTANQVALLVALHTFPDGTAPSLVAWFRVALQMKARFGSVHSATTLRHALHRLHAEWISGTCIGGRWVMSIRARGIEIAECRVPARIIGHGVWKGLPPERVPLILRANAGRPSFLPSLHVPGIDLDWRPDAYPRDFVEIARLTAPSIGLVLSYCARRIGRSWHLRVERFPRHDPLIHVPRRFAVRPLSLRELASLIDGTQIDGFRHVAQPGTTLLDRLFDQQASSTELDPQRRRAFIRIASTCYPELEALYAGRVENRVDVSARITQALAARRSA